MHTDLPWRMELLTNTGSSFRFIRHFYESLWNIAGMVLLSWYKKKSLKASFALYAAWYGLGRAWIEQLRADSLPYGGSFRFADCCGFIVCCWSMYNCVFQKKREKRRINRFNICRKMLLKNKEECGCLKRRMSNEELLKRLQPKRQNKNGLDTDTYNEIDDQFALCYAMLSKEKLDVGCLCGAFS